MIAQMIFSHVCLVMVAIYTASAAPKPNIIFMLADDLGWYDTAIYGDQSAETKRATHNLTQLADSGMRLSHHYVHWHCSPTRRSFLTGRSPLHHGEHLSNVDEDYIDLRWSWISDKLHAAGYVSHWYGKGHTGYKSMKHMPVNHGFNGGSVLYLGGAGSYYKLTRWNGTQPFYTAKTNPETYSTDLFGSLAVKAVEDHDTSKPLFIYLPWQAVHAPYDLPPSCKQQGGTQRCPVEIRSMIEDVDIWTGRLVAALKAKNMYDNTLMVFTSDNGGTQDGSGHVGGNNYPLRGAKHSNWQGGMRTQTFLSGGFLPSSVRGTTHNGSFHIVDWYPTLCHLAGVDGKDDAPVAPLPIDPTNPTKDIYGKDSYPSVDGMNIWGDLVHNTPSQNREYLWLSHQVLIAHGRYKIVTSQQWPNMTNNPPVTGWRLANGSWQDGGELDGAGCGVAFRNRNDLKPCLFDLWNDEREMHDLSSKMPSMVETMWGVLNNSALTAYLSRSPAGLIGHCDQTCANAHWKSIYGGRIQGPVCGVPGCERDDAAMVV